MLMYNRIYRLCSCGVNYRPQALKSEQKSYPLIQLLLRIVAILVDSKKPILVLDGWLESQTKAVDHSLRYIAVD